MAQARYADRGVDEADLAVVAVSGWGGDGRDDGVCAGVSIISRIAAVNCLDLCSVAFAFENCNAFHTFKVPRFPFPRFLPRATWSRVFQSRLFHPSNLVPGFPVPRFQRPRYFIFDITLSISKLISIFEDSNFARFSHLQTGVHYTLTNHTIRRAKRVAPKLDNFQQYVQFLQYLSFIIVLHSFIILW